MTGGKEKIKRPKVMQVKLSAENNAILFFKYKYSDITFKSIQMVHFSEATKTRNRVAYFTESSLLNLYTAVHYQVSQRKKTRLGEVVQKESDS